VARKLIVFDCEGAKVLEVSDLAQLDKLVKGRAAIAIIEGDVVALGTLELRGGEGAKAAAAQTAAQTASAQPGEAEGQARKVIAVLDQMFRGYYADVIEREAPYAEVHEVVGRGVQETLRVSEKRYLEPASDDFDVLRLVSRLSSSGVPVLFFTGDKRLTSQAQALGLPNLRVLYMPPSEFPGKENVAEAMINEIKKASKA
jgi:hypothetical protein